MKTVTKKGVLPVSLYLRLAFYQGYVLFVIQMDQGLVDCETFMDIYARCQNEK